MPKELSPKVLEVGFGSMPAIKFSGSLFDDPSVQYIGLDVVPEDVLRYKPTQIRKDLPHADFLIGNADALPLKDNSMDYVIMRSLFGQFTAHPKYWVSDINSIRDRGLFEAFRVLKPGGNIVILEENTPWESKKVEMELKEAGFAVKELEFQKGPLDALSDDDPWKKLKKIYFNTESSMGGPSRHWESPYIMIGIKPENPTYEAVERDIVIGWANKKQITTIRTYIKGESNTTPPIAR